MYLPTEVWRRIYDFDPTYKRNVWQEVMEGIPVFEDFQYEWTIRSHPYPIVKRWHCLVDKREVGCWVYEAAPWLTTIQESVVMI